RRHHFVFRSPYHQQLADVLDWSRAKAVADFIVDSHARIAIVAKHADLDELVRGEVHFDLGQHGFGQPFRADKNDGLEDVGLGAQVGTLGRRKFESWHEKE